MGRPRARPGIRTRRWPAGRGAPRPSVSLAWPHRNPAANRAGPTTGSVVAVAVLVAAHGTAAAAVVRGRRRGLTLAAVPFGADLARLGARRALRARALAALVLARPLHLLVARPLLVTRSLCL